MASTSAGSVSVYSISYSGHVKPGDKGNGGADASGLNTSKERLLRYASLALMALVLVGFGMNNALFAPFFPTEADRRGVSATVVGLIFGTFTAVMFVGSLVSGHLVRHLGVHFMIGAGTLLAGGATVLFGLLDHTPFDMQEWYIALCFGCRFVEGVGASLYNIAAYSMVSHLFPKSISTGYAFLEVAIGTGAMLGPALGGALYDVGGFSLPFYVLGGLLLVLGFISQILLRITLPNDNAEQKPASEQPGKPKLPWSHFFLKSYEIWILCIGMASAAIMINYPAPTMSLHFQDLEFTDEVVVGLVFLGGSLCYSVISLISGKLADTFALYRYPLMTFGSVVISLCYIFMGPAPFMQPTIPPSVTITIVTYLISTAALAVLVNPVPAAALEAAKKVGFEEGLDTSSMIAALYNAMWYLGSCAGTPLAGALMDSIGFSWGAFVVGSLGLFVTVVMLMATILDCLRTAFEHDEADDVVYEGDDEKVSIVRPTPTGHGLSSANRQNYSSTTYWENLS